jgi:hypothetical protein
MYRSCEYTSSREEFKVRIGHSWKEFWGAAVLGVEDSSLLCLHDQISCDFHNEDKYFTTAFDLILSLYRIPTTDPAVADLRESLLGPGLR